MASELPSVCFTTLAMLPPVTVYVLPSVSGLPVSSKRAQVHTVYQPAQATIWQGVPGPLGALGQVVQLPHGVLLPPVVQIPRRVPLPTVVQLPCVPAPCPPAYSGGQQVVTGTLVPHQPMGLGPWAVVQGEPLYPTGSCLLPVSARPGPPLPHRPTAQHCVRGPPVLHTLPGSTQKPLEASNNDGAAIEDSVPATSPHQTALAPPTGRTTTKPKAAVTTLAALGKPVDLPEQGPASFAEAFPEQAEDTTVNQMLAWPDTTDGEDTVLDVPDSPSLTAFLHKLPDLSEYVVEDGCPKEQAVVAGLWESEDTIPDVPDLTTFLSELPDLSEYVVEHGCPKERVVAVELGDSKDTIPDVPDTSNLTTCLDKLPDFSKYRAEGGSPKERAVVAGLGDGEVTVNNVPDATKFLNQLPDLSEYVAEGSCPKERAVAAGLGDSEDTIPNVPDVPSLTTSFNKLPHLLEYRAEGSWNKEQVAAVMLVDGKNTFPDVPGSLASTASFNDIPDFLEDGVEGTCPKDRLAAAMLGDADPFWGVAASPFQDPKGKQGRVAADLPTWLPLNPLETSEKSSPESSEETSEVSPVESHPNDPLKGPLESPLLSPLQIQLLSPLASPTAVPQHHQPCMAQLVEEALQRQPRLVITCSPLPPGVSSQVVPRSGKVGGKKAKRPAPASTCKTQETSSQDNNPPKKKKKMVVRQVAKHSRTLWEGKLDRDGAAAGGSGQQAGCRKRRASDSNDVPTK